MTDLSLDLDQFRETFFEEAAENAATLESALLSLESNPGDKELIDGAFRAAHSLKGGSGLFGLTEISRFTHALETILEEVRTGAMTWSREVADMLLRSVDIVRELIKPSAPNLSEEGERLREELLTFGRHVPGAESAVVLAAKSSADAEGDDESSWCEQVEPEVTAVPRFAVRFHPSSALFARGMDPLLVVRDLASTATIVETRVDTSRLPSLALLDASQCYIGWDFVVETAEGLGLLQEVFEFVEGYAEIEITPLAVALEPEAASESKDDVPPEPLAAAKVAALPVVDKAAPEAPAQVAVLPKANQATAAAATADSSTVRISTKKLDHILDLVGEVVIAKSMIGQALRGQPVGPLVREALTMLERQTRELQDGVMSVRMVPISTVFGRFHRVVRELGGKLGKESGLALEGMETEIDKAMVEQLVDPLTHLVRNAIDHGLETPAERLAAGKTSNGTLTLSAAHRGGNVVIEISDDGRGLNLERVREKAIERGLLAPDANPTSEQLHLMVFEPGFSTAAKVTDVSGRGVGMDVVKRNVEALGGSLFFTSQAGKGSLIRLQLPLTMAIIDGLLLRVGSSTFVVPLLSVVESFRPSQAQLSSILGRGRVLQFRGAPIPLLALGDVLSVEGASQDPTRGIVIVVEAGDETVGLFVDDLVADTQVVVKSLEANYRRVEGLSGAAVMGDGQIALILDVGALVRRVRPKADPWQAMRRSSGHFDFQNSGNAKAHA